MALSKIGSNQIDTAATPTVAEATVTGDLTVDTNTLKVDSSNNRVGIGDATPDDTLTIYGGTAKLRVGSTDSNHVRIGRNTSTGNFEMMRTTTGATDQVFFKAAEANNGDVILQEGGGNVGIGSQPYQGRLWVEGGDIWLRGNNSNRSINFTTDNSTDSTPNTGIRAVKGSGTQGILETICWDGSGSLVNIFKAVGNTNPIAGGTAGRSVAFAHAGVAIDRTWGNYPGITVMGTSDSGQTNQGEFRVHGANTRYSDYPGAHGGDFGVNFRIDGTNYYNNSDQRSKTNIVDNPHGLDEILQLTPRKFDRIKADGTIQPHLTNVLGFVAQEVEPILPEAVVHYADEDDGTDGYNTAYSLSDGPIVSTLVNAVKEQQTIINGLISRIEALEAG